MVVSLTTEQVSLAASGQLDSQDGFACVLNAPRGLTWSISRTIVDSRKLETNKRRTLSERVICSRTFDVADWKTQDCFEVCGQKVVVKVCKKLCGVHFLSFHLFCEGCLVALLVHPECWLLHCEAVDNHILALAPSRSGCSSRRLIRCGGPLVAILACLDYYLHSCNAAFHHINTA